MPGSAEEALRSARLPKRARTAFLALFGLVFWLGYLGLPVGPSPELDPSWNLALSHAVGAKMQFGEEIAFTHGPLGYLKAPFVTPDLEKIRVAWAVVDSAILALLVCFAAIRLPMLYQVPFLLISLLFAAAAPDGFLAWAIVCLASIHFLLWRQHIVMPALLGLYFSVLALAKFNQAMLIGAFVVAAAVHSVLSKQRGSLSLVAAFLIGLTALWLLSGQALANFPSYLASALEVARGYGLAMGLEEPRSTLAWGIVSSAVILGLVLTAAWTERRNLAAVWPVLGVLAAALFLIWKRSFVRADAHAIDVFLFCLLTAFSWALLFPRRQAPPRWLFVAAASLLAPAAVVFNSHPISRPADSLTSLWVRVSSSWAFVRDPAQIFQDLDDAWRRQAAYQHLPRVQAEVGDGTLDVFGHSQGVALINGLSYRPRPTLQSYCAYTGPLLQANEAYYRSELAPDFVLGRLETIDGRFPTQDDSLAFLALLQRYDPILQERDFILWKRAAAGDPEPQNETALRSGLEFDAWLDLTELPRVPLWISIRLRPTLLGRIRGLLYKPPQVELLIAGERSGLRRFRLIPSISETGFLLSPAIADQADLIRFVSGGDLARPERIAVVLADDKRKYFQRDIEVEVSLVQGLRKSPGRVASFIQYPMFSAQPVLIRSETAPERIWIGTVESLKIHAPGEMVFEIPKGAARFAGQFGLDPGAYQQGQTDGVGFAVRFQDATSGEETILLSRFLDPLTQAADRGIQNFDIPLPHRDGGRLLLVTDTGPNGRPEWDWSFWTGLRFE